MQKDEIVKRLKNIEGHMHGITGMVEQDSYCINVIQQIQAVQASLNKLNLLILNNHLHLCLTNALRGEDLVEREKVLNEVMQFFETATKV